MNEAGKPTDEAIDEAVREDAEKAIEDAAEDVAEEPVREVYGHELIVDLHNCSTEKFNREGIKTFMDKLCSLIDMEQEALHFWDFEDEEEYNAQPPHLKGTSAVQFIKTSDIVIHALDDMKRVYLNIFSCKKFNNVIALAFIADYFEGEAIHSSFIERD